MHNPLAPMLTFSFAFAPSEHASGDGGGDAAQERMAEGHKRRIQPLGPGPELRCRLHFHIRRQYCRAAWLPLRIAAEHIAPERA